MTTRFVWFDLGYTLVYQRREEIFLQFLEEQGIRLPLERLEEAYHLADKTFMREFPGVLARERDTFFPWYLGVLNYSLGLRFNLQLQSDRLHEIGSGTGAWCPFPFAERVLQTLKRDSIGLGLISNWDQTARSVLEETGLGKYLDVVVISSEVGWEKPNREIFLHALKQVEVTSEECFYVGDNYYDDVIGSKRAGMRPVLVNRFGRKGIEEIDFAPVIPSIEALPELISKK